MKHRKFLNETQLNDGYSAKYVLWEYFYLGGEGGAREREREKTFQFFNITTPQYAYKFTE